MQLDPAIYDRLKRIQWFHRCGSPLSNSILLPRIQLESVDAAISSVLSDSWADFGTHAQGELTGYLAKRDYDTYGMYWNTLARASREEIEGEVMPGVTIGLEQLGALTLSNRILLDLNRIALHAAFFRRFRDLPQFFPQLLDVYEKGHLPCDWSGDLKSFPTGHLIIY